jgi:hypothetical protein
MSDIVDPLDLSDEDFAKLSQTDIDAMFNEEPASDDAGSDVSDENQEELENPEEEESEEEETSTEEDSQEESDESQDGDDDDSETSDEAAVGDEPDADEEAESKEEETETENKDETPAVNSAEDFMKEIKAPFRANGKDMQIDSVEDVRKLMQMGANYNKKMAAIKPNLKFIKMLENNDLLNEESISYLIDLQKKDPAAITKLLKDSGTNPLELDLEKEHGYETKDTYTVSDNEVNLDGILDDIRDTDSFEQTINIVSNKWDAQSKQILVNNPDVIKTINDHVATGIYDKITQVMNRERVLGNLDGMSDIDAYKYVGDAIHTAGGFDDVSQMEQKPADEKPAKTVDPKVKDRKRAASSTKPTVTKKKKKLSDFDPLAMSDEDFEKMGTDGLF